MIFTQAERDALAIAPAERASAMLATGNLDDAAAVAQAALRSHQPILDIYTVWTSMALARIEQDFGAASANRCLEESLRTVFRPVAENFRNGMTREAIADFMQLLRMDAEHIDAVHEDVHAIVVNASGWAGQRLARLPAGAAFDMQRTCRAIECLCIEWLGYPPFVFDQDAQGTLRITLHKDPQSVPVVYFERLARKRDAIRLAGTISVAGALLFSASELVALSRVAWTLASEALAKSDIESARRHFALAKAEWYPAHHLYRDWITAVLSWLQREHGTDATWDNVESAYNRPLMGEMIKAVAHMDLRTQVEMLSAQFHQHAMKFAVIESEDGFEFRTTPCGSGGRLIDEDAYASPKSFAVIRQPAGVKTFGLAEMPVYCMHCPATNRMVLEQGGPYFLLVEPDIVDGRIRGNCSFHIYKRAEAVPRGMYERVGLVKP